MKRACLNLQIPLRCSPARPRHLLLAGVLLMLVSGYLFAQPTFADEYDIRGAMLINLTKFIDWPAWKMDAARPRLLICILGSDSIGPIAERYARNQSVAGKPLHVRHITSVEKATSRDVLYISAGEQKHVDPAVDELAKWGVLTVSESSNAATPYQVIGLPTLNDQVHIDINLRAAQRTGLTVSSKLLRLATVSR